MSESVGGRIVAAAGKQSIDWQNFQVPWGPIGEDVYLRTYSATKNRREIYEAKIANWKAKQQVTEVPSENKETFYETVKRTVDGNTAFVSPEFIEPDEKEKLTALMMQLEGLPGGRHLASTGLKGRQYIFNCHASGWDPAVPWEHFSFMFNALMQGGGVGANYSNRYMKTMPGFKRFVELRIICDKDHPDYEELKPYLSDTAFAEGGFYRVEDSREGWVESADILLKHAWGFNGEIDKFTIDVSPLRGKGYPLVSGGGVSAGPMPLAKLLTQMVASINDGVGDSYLHSDVAMNIDHDIADCVVAGGKRRSSRMSVKNWMDDDIEWFINCKNVDGRHWTTNISVETDDAYEAGLRHGNPQAIKVAFMVAEGARTNGEPGTWNRSLSMKGERDPELMYCPNPCGEICLQMWENCNLGHVNMQFFAGKPVKRMLEAFRLMARFLIRATFGDVASPRQREVVDRNRRIGVGFFGFHGWLALSGIRYSECWNDPFVLDTLAKCKEVVDNECRSYAGVQGIPVPVKGTTLAPNGTGPLLPGVSNSGQAIYCRRGKRRVRFADTDSELARKKREGYVVQKDKDAINTEIVTYYYQDPLVSQVIGRGLDEKIVESQDEVEFETSLKVQAMLQRVWADNAVSFTHNIPPEKMPSTEELVALLTEYHSQIKGTTIFPDKSRELSPLERITDEEWAAWTGPKEVTQVEDLCKNGCPTDVEAF